MTNLKSTIVLVHGGIVDGSGWEGLSRILKNDGYEVSIVPAAQRFMSKRGRRHSRKAMRSTYRGPRKVALNYKAGRTSVMPGECCRRRLTGTGGGGARPYFQIWPCTPKVR